MYHISYIYIYIYIFFFFKKNLETSHGINLDQHGIWGYAFEKKINK